jgi:hypothetical protein
VKPKRPSKRKPAAPPPVDPPAPSDPKAIALLTVDTLTKALRKAKASQVVSISKALTEANKVLAKASGTFEITEPAILRSEAWQRVWRVLAEAMAKHPDALRDVVAALERLRDNAGEAPRG